MSGTPARIRRTSTSVNPFRSHEYLLRGHLPSYSNKDADTDCRSAIYSPPRCWTKRRRSLSYLGFSRNTLSITSSLALLPCCFPWSLIVALLPRCITVTIRNKLADEKRARNDQALSRITDGTPTGPHIQRSLSSPRMPWALCCRCSPRLCTFRRACLGYDDARARQTGVLWAIWLSAKARSQWQTSRCDALCHTNSGIDKHCRLRRALYMQYASSSNANAFTSWGAPFLPFHMASLPMDAWFFPFLAVSHEQTKSFPLSSMPIYTLLSSPLFLTSATTSSRSKYTTQPSLAHHRNGIASCAIMRSARYISNTLLPRRAQYTDTLPAYCISHTLSAHSRRPILPHTVRISADSSMSACYGRRES